MKNGIYDQLVSVELKNEIDKFEVDCVRVDELDKTEATNVLAKYIMGVIEEELRCIDDDALDKKIDVINTIIKKINIDKSVVEPGRVLKTLMQDKATIALTGKTAEQIIHPERVCQVKCVSSFLHLFP